MKILKLEGDSQNQQENLIELLKQHAPEVFSENKIDVKQLRATLGEEVLADAERYGLNWAGKMDCFRTIQETTTNTLKPVREESVNFDNTENLFIEGDNLEVLKVLQKSYYGKVKMIYIDPPYNTGNDFIYNDKFSRNKREYLEEVGAIDKDGNVVNAGLYTQNTKDSGHFHSDWLNMMYPRLFLAKNLMRQDGVIFISIDDNELHNLRMVMDEIFGEDNFIANFIWEKRTNRENRKVISMKHDYIICYCKNKNLDARTLSQQPMSLKALANYKNPDNDIRGRWKSDPATAQAGHGTKKQFYILTAPNGKQHSLESGRCWLFTEDVMQEAITDNRIWFGKDGNGVPRIKTYLEAKEWQGPHFLDTVT